MYFHFFIVNSRLTAKIVKLFIFNVNTQIYPALAVKNIEVYQLYFACL